MQKNIRNNLVVGEGDKYKLIAKLEPYFSVSDCGELSAAVVSTAAVGVDIQNGGVRPRIVERFFSEAERKLPFALVWARKEAYAKWLGTGLTHASLAIDTCLLNFEEYDLADYGWPGYYLAVYPAIMPPPKHNSPS